MTAGENKKRGGGSCLEERVDDGVVAVVWKVEVWEVHGVVLAPSRFLSALARSVPLMMIIRDVAHKREGASGTGRRGGEEGGRGRGGRGPRLESGRERGSEGVPWEDRIGHSE